jgi:hypothetical protein
VAPQVKDITRNDGSVKNPTDVTFLTVTFDTRVNIDFSAFELTRLGSGGGPVGVSIANISVINGKTVVTLEIRVQHAKNSKPSRSLPMRAAVQASVPIARGSWRIFRPCAPV